MRVIIFIGHHKVGSSALQAHLAETAPEAARNGMLYPVVTRSDLDRLSKRIKGGDPTQALSRNVTEAHNALAFSMIRDVTGAPIPEIHKDLASTDEMFALIREQVSTFQPKVLVLAAEVFANFGALTPELINRLYEGIGLQGSDTLEVFAFLRRIDDYLVSWHGQRIRFGQKIRPLAGKAINHYQQGIHFDYRLMIEPWQMARPDTKLMLRPYNADVRKKGSALAFADALDLQLPALLDQEPQSVNQSIHRGVLDMARQANGLLAPPQARKVFNGLLKATPQLTITKSSQIELFGTRVRTQLVDGFTPIHDWLSEQTGETFFSDFDAVSTRLPIDEAYANVDALSEIKRGLMHEFNRAGKEFLTDFKVNRNFIP